MRKLIISLALLQTIMSDQTQPEQQTQEPEALTKQAEITSADPPKETIPLQMNSEQAVPSSQESKQENSEEGKNPVKLYQDQYQYQDFDQSLAQDQGQNLGANQEYEQYDQDDLGGFYQPNSEDGMSNTYGPNRRNRKRDTNKNRRYNNLRTKNNANGVRLNVNKRKGVQINLDQFQPGSQMDFNVNYGNPRNKIEIKLGDVDIDSNQGYRNKLRRDRRQRFRYNINVGNENQQPILNDIQTGSTRQQSQGQQINTINVNVNPDENKSNQFLINQDNVVEIQQGDKEEGEAQVLVYDAYEAERIGPEGEASEANNEEEVQSEEANGADHLQNNLQAEQDYV